VNPDDAKLIGSWSAEIFRVQIVDQLSRYRSRVADLPIPSYVREAAQSTVAAVDRWTAEREAMIRHG